MRPIVSPQEMASNPTLVRQFILQHTPLNHLYTKVFDESALNHSVRQVLVNVAKSLAAFQQTLISTRSRFDEFSYAIKAGDDATASSYPISAQRGLKTFIGQGRWQLCHFGADFSNGEFADIGIPYFTATGIDAGRYRGIKQLGKSPFNRLGVFNDGQSERNALATSHVRLQHRNWGEFKVPSLRAVVKTAPYMHNGSLPSLRDVVRHYSEINEERLHTDGEKILRPLKLNESEIKDLVIFWKVCKHWR